MDLQAIGESLRARFGDAIVELQPPSARDAKEAGPRDGCVRITPAILMPLMQLLRDDPDLRFDFLQNLTAVDWIKDSRIEVVYHLFSYVHRHELVVKLSVERASPRVASLAGLWRSADWMEREQYDLLGVVFEGHPDLRRLLMPDDWVGHPMRKDYREAREYRGMPTTRPSVLELLQSHDKAHRPQHPTLIGTLPEKPALAPPKETP